MTTTSTLTYLSLFSGGMGGDLAMQHLLGMRCLGYVEIEEYCQKLIRQRQEDGLIDRAPIFTDINSFVRDGYAASYTGMVDVITGGFPCQDISCAGKGAGLLGERSGLWKDMSKTISIVGPEIVFIENSPMLAIRGGASIITDLASMGMHAIWGTIGAGTVGSICEGERFWIVAFASDSAMLEGLDLHKYSFSDQKESRRWQYTRAISEMLSQDDYSRVKRNHDDVAVQMDRLKAIGNGQNPFVAATAWRILSGVGA